MLLTIRIVDNWWLCFVSGWHRVSFETSFDSKQSKLEPKLVSALSETKPLFRLFRFYTETESFDVSIEPKQTEDQAKQFDREFDWRPLLKVVYCPSRQHNFDIILSKDSFLPLLSNSSVFCHQVSTGCYRKVRNEPLSQGSSPGGPTGRWLTSTTSPATLWRILPWST